MTAEPARHKVFALLTVTLLTVTLLTVTMGSEF